MKVTTLHLNVRHQVNAVQQIRHAASLLLLGFAALCLSLSSCGNPPLASIRLGAQNIATQTFQVDATKGAVVNGQNGAILAIPAGAFMDAMGNTITGNVTLRLKEANRDVDILTGGLITQTGNELLASGGMYFIEGFAEGKAIRLNPAVGMYASLPTSKKDNAMGLYKGRFSEDKLDWKLTGQGEEDIPECDRDKASRAKCKKCERLTKMVKTIKPGKKPNGEDAYWAKRHYWENGKLYFYSSGSRKQVLSQDQINECQAYLQASEMGRELLGIVDQYKAEWKDRIGAYYSYRLEDFGWYNIDKVVKEDLYTFKGKVVDQDGQPIAGAQVHLYCKDADLKVHTLTTAVDGSYELKFAKSRSFVLYAHEKGRIGKQKATLDTDGKSMDDITLVQIDPDNAEGFLSDIF
jgi:hypothetical protein